MDDAHEKGGGDAENPKQRVGKNLTKTIMKTSNVSFENLLEQLSEDKINRVVDHSALRAGGLEILCPPAGSAKSKSSGTNSSSRSGGTGSTTGNNDLCSPFAICI